MAYRERQQQPHVMFDSALTPAAFWARLDDLDLQPAAPVKKLELVGGKTCGGNAGDKFVEAKVFGFAPLGKSATPH
jgi:hypothetical protein